MLSQMTFDTEEQAAKAFCDLGACALTEKYNREYGGNIVLTNGRYRVVDYRVGREGSVPFVYNEDATAYVHTHPVGGSAKFSGGQIVTNGKVEDFAGDIWFSVYNVRNSYVFRAGDRIGYKFDVHAYLGAVDRAGRTGTVYSSQFQSRIR
jgi:hypothetical protein